MRVSPSGLYTPGGTKICTTVHFPVAATEKRGSAAEPHLADRRAPDRA